LLSVSRLGSILGGEVKRIPIARSIPKSLEIALRKPYGMRARRHTHRFKPEDTRTLIGYQKLVTLLKPAAKREPSAERSSSSELSRALVVLNFESEPLLLHSAFAQRSDGQPTQAVHPDEPPSSVRCEEPIPERNCDYSRRWRRVECA